MRVPAFLARLRPDLGDISATERLRASLGAMLGLLVTGLVSRYAFGTTAALPLLIAPMGASAVLLFAVPSSPLAQPWSILGGNLVAALIGVTAARWIPDLTTAAAVGGALAIAAMMALRCLHPPSGAVALTAVLGGPAIRAAGYGFVLYPVGLNSVLLLTVALVFNNLTGRRYPHRPRSSTMAGSTASDAAVKRVLRRRGDVVDVGRHDLAALLEGVAVELGTVLLCRDLMDRDLDVLPEGASLEDALDRIVRTRQATLPICDGAGRLMGVVTQHDLIRHLRPTAAGRRAARLFRRSLRFDLGPSTVSDVAHPPPVTAHADTPLADVLDAMLLNRADHCPVVDGDGRLIGAITQADLLHWLAWQRRDGHGSDQGGDQPSSVIQRL